MENSIKSQLLPGNYMKVNSVMNFFCHDGNIKAALARIIKEVCPIHEGEFDIYYNTKDLKSIIVPDLFRELECQVITHMILNEEEKSKPSI
jgi:hypothetical protein